MLFCILHVHWCNFEGNTEYIDPKTSFVGSSPDVLAYALAFYDGLWAYDGWYVWYHLLLLLLFNGFIEREREVDHWQLSLAITNSVVNLQTSYIRSKMCTLGVVTLGRQRRCQIGSSAWLATSIDTSFLCERSKKHNTDSRRNPHWWDCYFSINHSLAVS